MSGSTYEQGWSEVNAPQTGGFLERCFDVVAAVVVLVGTAPITVVAACAVKVSSRGPVLVREVRLGAGDRPFELLAFRTTRVAGDRPGRSTSVGRVLVACSIDELPRWWNVLRGDLAIVGPAPATPDGAHGAASHRGDDRPGLTGIWRESGR